MINKTMIPVATGLVAILVTLSAVAVPFNSFDPKSMAMGGAGVAVANPGSSPFFNPALMSIANKKEDFALELPIIGARSYDPKNFVDAVNNFNDQAVTNLDTAINQYNFQPGASQPVIAAINAVNQEVLNLSDRPVQFEGGAGMVLAIPSASFGAALTAAASANFSGVLNYADGDTVKHLTADLTALDNCYVQADPAVNPAAFIACVQAPGKFSSFVDLSNPSRPTIKFTAQSTGGNKSNIQSKVKVIGVVMSDIGLSLSRYVTLMGSKISFGITPKKVSVTIFDYTANADSANLSDVNGKDYSHDYSDFNLDIGVAMDHHNGWRSGLVIKNAISQNYPAMHTDPNTGLETATGTVVVLKPQLRVGISHSNDWSTLALDLDLTRNEALGVIGDKSQYVAVGAEINAWGWAQIRLGYRVDMVNAARNVLSAGIGLSPFGIHLDLALAGNANEVGGAMQLGFRF